MPSVRRTVPMREPRTGQWRGHKGAVLSLRLLLVTQLLEAGADRRCFETGNRGPSLDPQIGRLPTVASTGDWASLRFRLLGKVECAGSDDSAHKNSNFNLVRDLTCGTRVAVLGDHPTSMPCS
jgi:hypothetical protein